MQEGFLLQEGITGHSRSKQTRSPQCQVGVRRLGPTIFWAPKQFHNGSTSLALPFPAWAACQASSTPHLLLSLVVIHGTGIFNMVEILLGYTSTKGLSIESIIMAMSTMWGLGMEPISSTRAKSALSHWTISPAQQPAFLYTAEAPAQEWQHPHQSLIKKTLYRLVYRPAQCGYLPKWLSLVSSWHEACHHT